MPSLYPITTTATGTSGPSSLPRIDKSTFIYSPVGTAPGILSKNKGLQAPSFSGVYSITIPLKTSNINLYNIDNPARKVYPSILSKSLVYQETSIEIASTNFPILNKPKTFYSNIKYEGIFRINNEVSKSKNYLPISNIRLYNIEIADPLSKNRQVLTSGGVILELDYSNAVFSPYETHHVYKVSSYDFNTKTNKEILFGSHSSIKYTSIGSDILIFNSRIRDLGLYEISLYDRGSLGGSSTVGHGQVSLINIDGKLDFLKDHIISGKIIEHYRSYGSLLPTYPDDFELITSGLSENFEVKFNRVDLRFKDKQYLLNEPHPSVKFNPPDTDNYLSVEGGVSLEGQNKPKIYGSVFNISPTVVNNSEVILQLNDNYSDYINTYEYKPLIPKVYDDSILLDTVSIENLTLSEFITLTPNYKGKAYLLYLTGTKEGFYIKLGSGMVGQVTADVNIPNIYGEGMGSLIYWVLLDSGLSSSEIDSNIPSMFTNYIGGLAVEEDAETKDLIDKLTISVASFWYFDTSGVFRLKQLIPPNEYLGSINTVLFPDDLQTIDLIYEDDIYSLPPKSITVRYKYNHTVQKPKYEEYKRPSDEALEYYPNPDRVEKVSKKWLEVTKETNAAVSSDFLEDMVVETCLYDKQSATNLLSRLVGLYGVKRDRIFTTVLSDKARNIEIGSIILLKADRYDLYNKQVLVLSKKSDYNNDTTDLILWG